MRKILWSIVQIVFPLLLLGQQNMIKSELKSEYTVKIHVDYQYILELPGQAASGEKLPLILFLHGSGERGDDLDLVKVHGPLKFIESHPEYHVAVLAPQCKSGEFWDAQKLSLLLDNIIANYPIDTTRIYLTGLSMGGYGAWDLAMFEPTRFAAIAPVCGTTFRHKLMAQKVKDIPIWIFHGAMDETVPFHNSARMVQKLKELEADVQFTVYPFTTHNAWDEAYADEELYKWFLSHKNE
ncbi:MAG: prolyl oligopeptidase family serine peptidase [Bacteroidales bacterium]|nr:prolyl oligopeptidase family serine peptidase [Bacteroidales bacterium]